MTDDQQPHNEDDASAESKHGSNTTYDLRKFADKAIEMKNVSDDEAVGSATDDISEIVSQVLGETRPSEQETAEAPIIAADSLFTANMKLQLQVSTTLLSYVYEMSDVNLIGRGDEIGNYTLQIDMTGFGAYRLGVSRKHAQIERRDNHLVLIDLNSRNGTMINRTRLDPNRPYTIKDGDKLAFGDLSVQVIFIHPI